MSDLILCEPRLAVITRRGGLILAESAVMAATLRCEIFPADLDATVFFYVSVLGFELVRDERDQPSAYVALARDTVQVGAAARPEVPDPGQRRPVTGVELVLEVDDLEQEYARVTGARWPLAEDLTERPWGLRDFRVLDPSGYYWRITGRARPSP